MVDSELQTMIHSDERHWWYRDRRRVIRALLDGLALARRCSILDAGCGSGRMLDECATTGSPRVWTRARSRSWRRGHVATRCASARRLRAAAGEAGWELVRDTNFTACCWHRRPPCASPGARGPRRRTDRIWDLLRSGSTMLELPLRMEAGALRASVRLPAGLSLMAVFRVHPRLAVTARRGGASSERSTVGAVRSGDTALAA